MNSESWQFDPEIGRVRRLLDKTGAEAWCPLCSADDWSAWGDLGNLMPVLNGTTAQGLPLETGGLTGGLPCYALICENCGFIRLHAAEVVERYADQEQAEPGS